MFNWTHSARTLADTNTAFCLVTILSTEGSVPREADTKMLVTSKQIYGTVGGGNLEQQAIKEAKGILTRTDTQEHIASYILGPELEQCCGGSVCLSFQYYDHTNIRSLIIPETSYTDVMLFGAGHVGQAVAYALTPLPFDLHWYDPRSEKINGDIHHLSKAETCVEAAAYNALFLVSTHDHDLDYQLVRAILTREHVPYCGMIGSDTKKARFLSRLRKEGFTAQQLSRLTCPIGISGIKGKEPEIIAASVAAQLLQTIGETDER
jgi:xanthine dehydrogenase accessory factor